jgi:hypothetical protein
MISAAASAPSQLHSDANVANLVEAMVDVRDLKLPFVEKPNIAEFRRVHRALPEAELHCAFSEFKKAPE